MRRKVTISPDAQLGLAWYTRQAWARLRELADDRDKLDDTFEDWERGAMAAIRDLESIGRQVHKVPIDVDALVAWCCAGGHRIDSAARTEYVVHLLKSADQ